VASPWFRRDLGVPDPDPARFHREPYGAFPRQRFGGCRDAVLASLRAASSTRTLRPMSEAFIVQPSEGWRLDLGGFEAVVLATSAQTSGDELGLAA